MNADHSAGRSGGRPAGNAAAGPAAASLSPPDAAETRAVLARLVAAMAGLKADGRFVEPNLDGTAGDYVSFDSWEWPQGVGLYGLYRLWELGEGDRLRGLFEAWFDARLREGLPPVNINTTAPMLALSLLWRRTGEPRWAPVLGSWADRLLSELPRTPEGGLPHIVSDKVNDAELWDDTLMMAGLFLASYGQGSGRRDLVDEACRQLLVHARYLADPASGLWFHGWTFDGRHNFARALWGRGNAWVSLALLELPELADIPAPVKDYAHGMLKTQLATLVGLQASSGAWHTLLDDPGSYEETSATAGFGSAMLKAARLGIGPTGCLESGLKALRVVMDHVDATGSVSKVSYGTRMGRDLDFYRNIPFHPTGYGQALAILCLSEGLRLTEARP